MELEELRERMAAEAPQAELEIQAALVFANEHLKERSRAFTGALLGLLVGKIFGKDAAKFDQWTALIRADMLKFKKQVS